VADHSERKLATVLFADLVDSTASAGEQDPERTRARLERFYDAMTAEIEAAGGTVEKSSSHSRFVRSELCELTKRCSRRPTSASAGLGSTGTPTRPRR
jgi:hypothetical protein